MKSKTGAFLILIAYLGFISLGLPDAVLGIAWPSIRDFYTREQSDFGFILLFASLGYVVSSFSTGQLMTRITVGTLLAVSTILVCISLIGFSVAPYWVLFLLCASTVGMGSGAIDTGINSYAAGHFSIRHMNWLHACYSVGAMLGPVIMAWVFHFGMNWRFGYQALAGAMAILALTFWSTRGLWMGSPTSQLHAHPERARLGEALRRPLVGLHMFLFFLYSGVEVIVGQWSYTVLTESRGFAVDSAGFWVGWYWANLAAGRFIFGWIVDRFGADRLLRLSTAGAVVGSFLLVMGSIYDWCTIAGLALTGFVLAPIYPCLMSKTPVRIGVRYAAHAVGFQASSAMVGAVLLPGMTGYLIRYLNLEAAPVLTLFLAGSLLLLHEITLHRSLAIAVDPS